MSVQRSQLGFSLIEVMVGVALGMLAVLIMTQSISVLEGQKSTTVAGSDAQENALIALGMIEQDVRNSGVGYADIGAFECDATRYKSHLQGAAIAGFELAPVIVTDGGAASDSISIRTGDNFLGTVPAFLTSAMAAATNTTLAINRAEGFEVGDLVIVAEPSATPGVGGTCTLMQVTAKDNLAKTLTRANAAVTGLVAPNPNAPGFNAVVNPDAAFQAANNWIAHSANAKVFNIRNLTTRTYSLDASHNLQVTETRIGSAPNAQTLVRDVVAMQIRYGAATGGNEIVNTWAASTGAWTALDPTEVKQVKAVEIILVTRAGKKETTAVTTAVPQGAPEVANLPDWQNYRYKRYVIRIPLRNVLWANV